MTPNRLNRFISQMEAFRRKHEQPFRALDSGVWVVSRFTASDEQYAWSNLSEGYGGIPQEDHP
jgi:hypothetical protein